jgi:hydrogenase/urease accessory protein HupE
MYRMLLTLAWTAALLVGSTASAHPLSPGLLQLEELGNGRYAVLWKVPSSTFDATRLVPALPPACRALDEPAVDDAGNATITRWTVDCGPTGLTGATLRVLGIDQSSIDVLVRIVPISGPPLHSVLSASATTWTLPVKARLADVLASFGKLGVRHILSGYDHVLFVLALTLFVRSLRELVIAITGFTLGHSLTLTLATLNLLRVPPAPVEVLIACSIVLVAAEVVRRSDRPTLSARAPWLVTAIFGLFHGLGFAGALREAGLPYGQTAPALAAFNVGVELGQLGIVCACLMLAALIRRVPLPPALRDPRIAAYAIGILGAFWTLERLAVAFARA